VHGRHPHDRCRRRRRSLIFKHLFETTSRQKEKASVAKQGKSDALVRSSGCRRAAESVRAEGLGARGYHDFLVVQRPIARRRLANAPEGGGGGGRRPSPSAAQVAIVSASRSTKRSSILRRSGGLASCSALRTKTLHCPNSHSAPTTACWSVALFGRNRRT